MALLFFFCYYSPVSSVSVVANQLITSTATFYKSVDMSVFLSDCVW